jgi:hypothetical protein
MISDSANEISLENLKNLQKLFCQEWPKHIAIVTTLKLLIKRVEQRPELEKSFKLFALSSNWRKSGEVLLVVSELQLQSVVCCTTQLIPVYC